MKRAHNAALPQRTLPAMVPIWAAVLSLCFSEPHPATAQGIAPPARPRIIADMSTIEKTIRRGATVYRVSDYRGANDRETLNAAFAAMKTVPGNKILEFEPREYNIFPPSDNTFEPVIGVDGVENLIVEGKGATLVARNSLNCQKGYFSRITDFKNVVVRDLHLTYRPLPFTQGRITELDEPAGRITVEKDQGFAHFGSFVYTPNCALFTRVGLRSDPRMPKPNSPSWLSAETVAHDGSVDAVDLGDGRFSIRAGNFFNRDLVIDGEYSWEVGDPFVMWKRLHQDAFCFELGEGLLVENLRVDSALAFAIKLRGIINGRVDSCVVAPGEGAMMSGSADGINVQQSRSIVIENCRLVSAGDDLISFLNHGAGVNGMEYEEALAPPYPVTNADVIIRNNVLHGGNRNGILLMADRAAIEGNDLRHVRQYGIKFTGDDTSILGNTFREIGSFTAYRHIVDELDTGIICSEEWSQSRASIKDNLIEDWHHMPAILLKAISDVEVASNTFRMGVPGRLRENLINSYLDEGKAIVLTHGVFHNAGTVYTTPCSNVLIASNTIQTRGEWSEVSDAIHYEGDHENVDLQGNSVERLPPEDAAFPGPGMDGSGRP